MKHSINKKIFLFLGRKVQVKSQFRFFALFRQNKSLFFVVIPYTFEVDVYIFTCITIALNLFLREKKKTLLLDTHCSLVHVKPGDKKPDFIKLNSCHDSNKNAVHVDRVMNTYLERILTLLNGLFYLLTPIIVRSQTTVFTRSSMYDWLIDWLDDM